MTIAALIVEYRSPEKTAICVSSLLAGDGCDLALVVDNSDDEGDTASRLMQLLENDPRVMMLSAQGNIGFAAGVNLGLEHLRQSQDVSRVLVINNDAVAEHGVVIALAAVLQDHSRAALAFPAIVHAGSLIGEIYYHKWLATVLSRPGWGRFQVPRGCCFMLALDRWRGSLFDERFFMYGEEIELGWRLRNEDAFVFVPGCLVQHEGSGSSVRGSDFYEEHTAAAHWLLSRVLTAPGWERVAIAGSRALAIVARSLIRALRARNISPLKGVWNGWWRARRQWSMRTRTAN